MDKHGTRRDFLKTAVAGSVSAALLPLGARFGSAADTPLEAVRLTERVTQIIGAGTSSVVLETSDGLVLVDSGSPQHADVLVRFIEQEFAGAPVRVLFNTHWHVAHTGANEQLAEAGARIVAHENTRLWMTTEYYVEWEKKNYLPRPRSAWPTETFHSSDPQPLVLEHGGHVIEYGHLAEAHTDGDIYVFFRDENVLVAGDALAVGTYPVLDYSTGGWIGGLQNATHLLIELADERTQVVPGEGPVQGRAALEAQSAMLDVLHERMRVGMIAGKSAAEIAAENFGEGYEALGDPAPFVSNAYNGLWWGGRLRGPI